MLEMLTKILYFVQNKSFNIIYLLIFWQNKFGKKFFIHTCAQKGTQSHQNWTFVQNVAKKCSIRFNLIISNVWRQIVLVPNCPVPNCPGAKLSWCQIVRCQIVLPPKFILGPQTMHFMPHFWPKTTLFMFFLYFVCTPNPIISLNERDVCFWTDLF